MSDLQKEKDFFQNIARLGVELVAKHVKNVAVAQNKGDGDYSTQIDIAMEELIVTEISRLFPGDAILAEEAHSEANIPEGRIWIIDPICGTLNLGKGINNFCTNIALADNGKLIAACVIDHSTNERIWSIGNNKVYVDDSIPNPINRDLGINIDVDFGSVRNGTQGVQEKHRNFVKRVLDETDFNIISLNTSLGVAYCAIGKIDGFVWSFSHPWDSCAGSFLIQQAGRKITALDGDPWSLTTVGAICARTSELHQKLLEMFND